MSQNFVAGVFALVYVGMIFGGLPGLALDRTALALIGAIALLAGGALDARSAWAAVDMPTMSLLFGLMLVSAQLRLSGFYTLLARRIAAASLSPRMLLLLVMAASAALSAVLVNDIVALALTPILAEGCIKRGLNPVPYLLGLACAANIGSAATLIGNPQNMLIGQVGQLSFAAYALDALPPVVAGTLAAWGIISWFSRGDWVLERSVAPVPAQDFLPWPALKGGLLLAAALFGFLFTPIPREVLALAAGALVLVSRRMHSRTVFALVDWQLLLLFLGLFVVNHALLASGLLERLFLAVGSTGVDLAHPAWLFAVTALL